MISNSLKRYRKAKGLSQRKVAQILGLPSYCQVCKWERGLCYPSVPNLFKLAAIYGTSAETLYEGLIRELKEVSKDLI